jgi:hypothetical protein
MSLSTLLALWAQISLCSPLGYWYLDEFRFYRDIYNNAPFCPAHDAAFNPFVVDNSSQLYLNGHNPSTLYPP